MFGCRLIERFAHFLSFYDCTGRLIECICMREGVGVKCCDIKDSFGVFFLFAIYSIVFSYSGFKTNVFLVTFLHGFFVEKNAGKLAVTRRCVEEDCKKKKNCEHLPTPS